MIVSADYAPGTDAIDAFTNGMNEGGGKVVDVIKVPLGTTDFSSYFQRIEDDAPNCLYVFMPGGPMSIGMAKGFAERGWAKKGMIYLGAATTSATCRRSATPRSASISVGSYVPRLDNPGQQGVRRRLQEEIPAAISRPSPRSPPMTAWTSSSTCSRPPAASATATR